MHAEVLLTVEQWLQLRVDVSFSHDQPFGEPQGCGLIRWCIECAQACSQQRPCGQADEEENFAI
jgi:hypothetical protein